MVGIHSAGNLADEQIQFLLSMRHVLLDESMLSDLMQDDGMDGAVLVNVRNKQRYKIRKSSILEARN